MFLKETGFRLDGETALFFAEWKDIKEYVENRKQKTAEYRVTLLRDYDVGGAFILPKAGTYAGLTLTGVLLADTEGGSRYPALTFTGSITLTGNVTIEKLKKLCGVKKAGTDLTADFNISMGNYRLELKEVADNSLKNINGSAKSTLILHGISVKGTIAAGNLFMENVTAGGNVRAMGECLTVGEIKIPGTFTAEGLQKSYEQTLLSVRQGKKITIGKRAFCPAIHRYSLQNRQHRLRSTVSASAWRMRRENFLPSTGRTEILPLPISRAALPTGMCTLRDRRIRS